MMFSTHLALGLTAATFFSQYLDIKNKAVFFAVVFVSSILPDIDMYNSKIGKKIKPLSFLLNIFFGHRKIFHSLLFAFIVCFLISFFNMEIGLAFFIGYASHLLIDSLTPSGTMPLYPLSNRKIKGFIDTYSFSDYALFVLSMILFIYLLL
ncbi:MAG: metal-dependent hydrolase [Candidatus Nanoarchaeia archaeon]|nr:metal-dependent hydrolase [Candidatus Nanoarchaeia archaeon]